MTTFITVELVHMECGECGAMFGISRAKHTRCSNQGEDWYCPNGHCRVFNESENAKLKDRLERVENQRNNARSASTYYKNSARSHKAAHTRTKNRVHSGVCTHCNRHFANVERHMASQHSEEMVSK